MENLEFLREWKLPCLGDVDSEERSFFPLGRRRMGVPMETLLILRWCGDMEVLRNGLGADK
jgi:hypothetical protein